MNERINCISQNDIYRLSLSCTTAGLSNAERGECNRIELAGNGQVSIALKLLHRRGSGWSSFTIRLAQMVAGRDQCFLST